MLEGQALGLLSRCKRIRQRGSTNLNIQKIVSTLDREEIEQDDNECLGHGYGLKACVHARVRCSEKDIGDKGHDCGRSSGGTYIYRRDA